MSYQKLKKQIIKQSRNLYLAFLVMVFTCFEVQAQTIRIAAAANTQFVMDSIKKVFEKNHGDNIELIINSSGKLTAQIKHGAPYDLFLSADMKYPQSIYQSGAALTPPKTYAYGQLVLWSQGNNLLKQGLRSLKNPDIKTIAVANPETAPYGVATISALKKAGLYKSIKSKIVYGESISQVNQYFLLGVADVAFTALSVVKSPSMQGKGQWILIPDKDYADIKQGVILLKHAKKQNLSEAKAFYNFLFSPKGKAIFKYFGYKIKN
ncbi:MAG TPA: molybdate ABC transporter substrate-binding protein [Chitinophagaceae bacterium]|nr:molybdate ABC transporter substrate-binding protein [Chitinophagaceae bacterium]